MSSLPLRLYHRLPSPARALAATLRGWYLRWSRYGRETPRLIAEAQEREHWIAAQWDTWRQERLGYVLHRAATRVPYYRAQWAARRRQGDDASWEVLENWPILDNDRVREDPAAFFGDDRNPRWMFNEHTSGTTGRPLVLWRTHRTIRSLYALSVARTRLWHGVSRRDRWAMLGGQLIVPTARRRPPACGGDDQLPPEHGPAVAARDTMPQPRPRDRQGIQGSDRPVRPPQHQRPARRAARVLVEHPARIPVIAEEGGGVFAHPVVVEDRPVLEDLPGRVIALPAPRRPLRAVVRHAGGRPVQHVPQPFLPPGVPLRRTPVLALLGLRNETRRLATVARPAQVPPAQRG